MFVGVDRNSEVVYHSDVGDIAGYRFHLVAVLVVLPEEGVVVVGFHMRVDYCRSYWCCFQKWSWCCHNSVESCYFVDSQSRFCQLFWFPLV